MLYSTRNMRYTIIDHGKGDEPVPVAHVSTALNVSRMLNGLWVDGEFLNDYAVVDTQENTQTDAWTWQTKRGR